MLQEYKKNTNIGIGIGFVLLIIGSICYGEGLAVRIVCLIIPFIGAAAFIWGCFNYAKGKGYSQWFGLLGLLFLVGLLILVTFPDKHKSGALVDPTKSAKLNVIAIRRAIIVAVVVLGILLFIQYPSYQVYKERPYNSAAQADLMNAIEAQEAYYEDNKTYADSIEKLIGKTYGLQFTEGVTVSVISANRNHYKMKSFHSKTGKIYIVKGPSGEIKEYKK